MVVNQSAAETGNVRSIERIAKLQHQGVKNEKETTHTTEYRTTVLFHFATMQSLDVRLCVASNLIVHKNGEYEILYCSKLTQSEMDKLQI